MIMQEYKQRYFYILKMTDETGSSNKSSSRADSRRSQPNESEVSITVIVLRKKVLDHIKLKESIHQ